MRSLSPYSRNTVLEKLEQSLQRIKKRNSVSSALDYDVEKDQFYYPKPSLYAFNIAERFPKLPTTLEKLLKPQLNAYIKEEHNTKFSLRSRRFSWNTSDKNSQSNQSDIIPIAEEVDIKKYNLPSLSISREKNTIQSKQQMNPLREKFQNQQIKQKKSRKPPKISFLPKIKITISDENPQDAQMEEESNTTTFQQKPFLLEKIQIKPLLKTGILESDIKHSLKENYKTQGLSPILESSTEKIYTTREKRFDSIMNYKMDNQLNELKLMLKNYEKYKQKSTKKQQKQVSFLL